MRQLNTKILAVILTVFATDASAAQWFVDNSVGSSGNGTSWASAWKRLSNIAWGSVAAGDTIFISGGVTSQTYFQDDLIVGASGSVGNPITITNGSTQGKPGEVVIDGTPISTSSSYPIDTNGQNNLDIGHLTVQNSTGTTIWAHGSSVGSTVSIHDIVTHQGGNYVLPSATFSAAGQPVIHFASALPAYVQVSTGIYIHDATRNAAPVYPANYITAMTSTSVTLSSNLVADIQAGDVIWLNFISAHGIEMSFNAGDVIAQNIKHDTPTSTQAAASCEFNGNNTGNITYSHNTCINSNGDPSGHSDCMFMDCERNVTMEGNYCTHPNGGGHNHGMIDRAPVTGYTWLFKNNVFYLPDLGGVPDINVWWDNDAPEGGYPNCASPSQRQGTVKFYNNTVWGGLYGVYLTTPNSEVKNNIIAVEFGQIGLNATTPAGSPMPPANSDYNIITATDTHGNLWATACGGNTGSVRGTQARANGKYYYEFRLGVPYPGSVYQNGNSLFGIGNANAPLNTWAGSDLNGIAMEGETGNVFLNGGEPASFPAVQSGHVMAIAADIDNKKVWWKDLTAGTGWNNDVIGNQNPATNTGGVSIANMNPGPYFPYISFSATDSGAINASGSAFAGAMPSGYLAWGGTFDPSQLGTAVTLGACTAYSTDFGYNNLPAWKGHGYDLHSLDADPRFINAGTNSPSSYAVQVGSPAINAGTVLSTVTTDYSGMARPQGSAYDIGAFEYGGSIACSLLAPTCTSITTTTCNSVTPVCQLSQ